MGSQVWDITTVNKRKISPVISHRAWFAVVGLTRGSLPLATWGPLRIAHKIPRTTTPISINKQDLQPGQDHFFLTSLFAIVIPESESYVVTTCHFKNHFKPLHLRECVKCIHLVIFRRVIDFFFFLDFSQTRLQYSQSKNNNVLTSQHFDIYSLFLHVVTVLIAL